MLIPARNLKLLKQFTYVYLKVLITRFQKTVLNFFRKWFIGVRVTVHEILRIRISKEMLTQQKFDKIFLLQTLISPKQQVLEYQNSFLWENVRRHFRPIYVNYKNVLRFLADNTISNNLRTITIMCTPSFLSVWDGVEPPSKFSKRGHLTGSHFLGGSFGKEGGEIFQKGCSFYIKNKLKPEIFNDKIFFYKQKRFSLS